MLPSSRVVVVVCTCESILVDAVDVVVVQLEDAQVGQAGHAGRPHAAQLVVGQVPATWRGSSSEYRHGGMGTWRHGGMLRMKPGSHTLDTLKLLCPHSAAKFIRRQGVNYVLLQCK